MSILSIIQKINKHIARANKLTKQNIISIMDNDLFIPNVLLKAILHKKKDELQRVQNLELNLEQTKRINFFVNKRYDDFQNNTSKMLDSILKRKKEKVDFQKIIISEEIITEPRNIKEYIIRYFATWTKHNLPNNNYWHI